jgi:hypothetical protein
MRRSRRFVLFVCLVLLALGGVAAWRAVHGGYPDAVYFEQIVVSASSGGQLSPEATDTLAGPPDTDEWIDPWQGVIRDQPGSTAVRRPMIVRGPVVSYSVDGTHLFQEGVSPEQTQVNRQRFLALRRAGFGGEGDDLLAHAHGPIARTSFTGRAALRFVAAQPYASSVTETIWLDAQTRVPLQQQLRYSDGLLVTTRYLQQQRLAPGALPADFFDAQQHPSLWDRFSGWLQDHVLFRGR